MDSNILLTIVHTYKSLFIEFILFWVKIHYFDSPKGHNIKLFENAFDTSLVSLLATMICKCLQVSFPKIITKSATLLVQFD